MILATDVWAEFSRKKVAGRKKSRAISPAPEIVSTLFPQLFDFG
jgi:hypothetical protein